MKRIAFLAIGILISAVSLYLALKGFNWSDLGRSVAAMQPIFLLLMIPPYILTFMTKVWRWRVLFHPDEKRYSNWLLFSSLMLSYIPLPFRMGEVARAASVTARTSTPPARVISTIVLEKVLDVLTLLLLLGVSLIFVSVPRDMQGNATTLGGIFLVVTLGILVLVLKPDLARGLVRGVAARLPARFGSRIEETTEHTLQGFAPLSDPPTALKIGLWSLATWSVNAVTIYLMMRAFNIQVAPMAAVTLIVATNLGMAVPSAPGYIGTFEWVVVSALAILGVAAEEAQSFALVYHFIGLVPVALIGVFLALQQGVGMATFQGRPEETGGDVSASPRATQPGLATGNEARKTGEPVGVRDRR